MVARPPLGATPVNHFTQTAFIQRPNKNWNIIRWITFTSDSEDGKVKAALARSHAHGVVNLVNYGSSGRDMLNGKKMFAYLFQELGGFQIRHWELQTGSGRELTQRLDCVRINWLFGLFVYCGKGKAESVGWEGRKTKWELLASALPMGLDTGVNARRNPLPQPQKLHGKTKKKT